MQKQNSTRRVGAPVYSRGTELIGTIAIAVAMMCTAAPARAEVIVRLCARMVTQAARAFAPAPENPLPPSAIAEIAPEVLELYAATPHGALVEIHRKNGEIVSGVTVLVGFQAVKMMDGPTTWTIPFSEVEKVVVLSTSPTLLRDVTNEIIANQEAEARRRGYLRFQKLSDAHWEKLAQLFPPKLESFREKTWRQRRREIASLAAEVDASIVELTGVKHYGLHYNMHGGAGYQFVQSGGIKASSGDAVTLGAIVSLSRGAALPGAHNMPPTVFYYSRSESRGLGYWATSLYPGRTTHRSTGTYAMLFDVNAIIDSGRAERYSNGAEIAISFAATSDDGFRGVRYDDLLLPPMQIMADVPRRLGVASLTEQEQTLATLLHLKALLADRTLRTLVPRALRD